MNSETRRARLSNAIFYGIVDFGYVQPEQAAAIAAELVKGGADVIQLRAKGFSQQEIHKATIEILPTCHAAGVPFVLNDFPEIAAELGTDGVHIGQDDGHMSETRKIVGDEIMIGRSTHSLDQARAALTEGADYIGFGPLFPTPTKKGRPGIGLENISTMEHEIGQHLPAFCIGGIKPDNLPQVIAAGARRCVIVSQILTAKNISEAVSAARKTIAACD